MKLPFSFTTYILLLLSTITSADAVPEDKANKPIPKYDSTDSSAPDPALQSHHDTQKQWYQPIPEQLQNFIAQFNSPHPEAASKAQANVQPDDAAPPAEAAAGAQDLRKRQRGVGGANGDEPTTTIATQMSPVTTYLVNGKPVIFTQTFVPTPDPWAGPVQGTIGLGSIQGQIGTVRSS